MMRTTTLGLRTAYLLAAVSLVTSCYDAATCADLGEPCPGDEIGAGGGTGQGDSGVDGRAGAGGADASVDAAETAGATGAGGTSGSGGVVGAGGSDASVTEGGGTAGDAQPDLTRDALSDAQSEEAAACDTDASPHANPCVLAFGVFVSPSGSDATNDGSQGHPFGSIAKGLSAAKAANKRLYVCTNAADGGLDAGAEGDFGEPLTIGADLDGTRMYGGYDCATWQYVGGRSTRVRTAPGAVPLTISNTVVGVTIEDFEFAAADATAAGGSSIAVIANAAQSVRLRNVKMVAGKGGKGQAGTDGTKGADGWTAARAIPSFMASCTSGPSTQSGGSWTEAMTCGSVTGSMGGAGGTASRNNDGTPGIAGAPRTNVTPADINNRGSEGSVGGDGTSGSPGNAGTAGAAPPSDGAFSYAGYTPASPGGDGQNDGFPGQGGGGGGASNVPGTAPSVCIGASGGAGGMGGCGGTHGTGGKSGGASVALLTWNSSVTLDACTLLSSAGGAGGKGGNGGPGGLGQEGAIGGAAYSDDGGGTSIGHGGKGGNGGDGGPGGPGAGGNGGPSCAIAHKGTAPTLLNGTTRTPGTGGVKGAGGTAGSTQAPDGAAGDTSSDFTIPEG